MLEGVTRFSRSTTAFLTLFAILKTNNTLVSMIFGKLKCTAWRYVSSPTFLSKLHTYSNASRFCVPTFFVWYIPDTLSFKRLKRWFSTPSRFTSSLVYPGAEWLQQTRLTGSTYVVNTFLALAFMTWAQQSLTVAPWKGITDSFYLLATSQQCCDLLLPACSSGPSWYRSQ